MHKQTIFTMSLESDLHEEFMAAANAASRPASLIMCDLMREFVQRQREAQEYSEYLHVKVSAARGSIKAGLGRAHEEVEAEFAARRAKL